MAKRKNIPGAKKTVRKGPPLWFVVLRLMFKKPQRYILCVLFIGAFLVFGIRDGSFVNWWENVRQEVIISASKHGFVVREVDVAGRSEVPVESILTLLNIQYGDPIFDFSPAQARKILEQLKWVRQARVERHLPSKIYIELQERVPIFLYQEHGKVRPIDIEGILLPNDGLARFKGLPILIGTNDPKLIQQAMFLATAHDVIRDNLKAIVRISDRRWDFQLKHNVTVKLPEEEPEIAVAQLAKMIKEEGVLLKEIATIDFRVIDKVVVRPSHRANLLIERPDFSSDRKGEI